MADLRASTKKNDVIFGIVNVGHMTDMKRAKI